ncbi:hypothetical protein [Rosistilla oblonga]|uniref:hypothetical protein n=1 Tax=Rosistilla oblonga TaxID=2527990 RepID=UPI003A97D01B
MTRLEDCFDDDHLSDDADDEERLDFVCDLNSDGKILRGHDEDFAVDCHPLSQH